MRLYIAGPLFTPYQRALHAENVRRLRAAGHECFVPQEQGFNLGQAEATPGEVFQGDLAGIKLAHALVALLDDPDVSSGTACEMGIFYELARHDPRKKGILGLLTDDRARRRHAMGVGEMINFFTHGCVEKCGRIYATIDEVIAHLVAWEKELAAGGLLDW